MRAKGEITGDERKGIVGFVLGDAPVYDSSEFYSPYTLEDFRIFYRKVCSQLKESESDLLYRISKSSENDLISHSNLIGEIGRYGHPNLPRPFEDNAVKEAKKKYLQGLLCGASIDYLEVVSDEFRLVPADTKLIREDNFVLFISRYKKDGSERTLSEVIKVSDGIGNDTTHSGSYFSHHVDRNDYALVGKRLPEDDYRKRLHEWELDVNWDGE